MIKTLENALPKAQFYHFRELCYGSFKFGICKDFTPNDDLGMLGCVAIQETERWLDYHNDYGVTDTQLGFLLNTTRAILRGMGESLGDIRRMALNLNYPNGKSHSVWHLDHKKGTEGKSLIFYLHGQPEWTTEVQCDGKVHSFECIPNNAILFDNHLHRVTMPDQHTRLILVCTYT